MIELISPDRAPRVLRGELYAMLCTVDQEFWPSLSSRSDSLSMRPAGNGNISRYFQALLREDWLVYFDGGDPVGLMSFMTGTGHPVLSRWSPLAYVTTVAVLPQHRRRGIALRLYESLFHHALDLELTHLATRTWCTNRSHLGVLAHTGFRPVIRVRNDRPGGVATVYLVRRVDGAATP